jgi:hypothetical protein
MRPALSTFITTVYVRVDDTYKARFAHRKPVRPGAKPKVSDSEVLTLAILAQHYPRNSERSFLSFVNENWQGYFPRTLSQSSFNRRVRDLSGVLAALVPQLAGLVSKQVERTPVYEAADGTGVPLVRNCRSRTRLFGEGASFGKRGPDHEWFYGFELFCVVDQHGAISGFMACRADTEERWLAEGEMRWRADPGLPQPSDEEMQAILGPSHGKSGVRTGPQARLWPREGAGINRGCVWVTDQGYAGKEWQEHWWERYRTRLVTGKGLSPQASTQHRRLRMAVERVFGVLFEHFGLAYPKARTLWGAMARISAKIAAFNMTVYINCLLGRPRHSVFNPIA